MRFEISNDCYLLMALTKIPPNGRVGVIGAGISGLSYAYFLNKLRPDVKITVFEKSNQPGGWIRSMKLTNKQQNIVLEKGPRTLRGVSDGTLLIIDILKQLNIENELQVMKSTSIANRKYIVGQDHQLVQVPSSIKSFLRFVSSGVVSGIPTGAIKELFQKVSSTAKDESIESFIKRRFKSTALTDNIMSAILHGIYAGDVSKLSVKSVVPGLVALEKDHGSIVKGAIKNMYKALTTKKQQSDLETNLRAYEQRISPKADLRGLAAKLKGYPIVKLRNGLQELPLALSSYLQSQANVDILYDSKIDNVDFNQCTIKTSNESNKYDHLRSTINVKALASLAQKLALTDEFSKIEYVSIFMANIYSRERLVPSGQEGFGFLVPKAIHNQERLLGIIFDSDIEKYSHRLEGQPEASDGYSKITLMMGGHFFKDEIPSNSINLRAVKKCLQQYLGVDILQRRVVLRDEANEKDTDVTLEGDDILISYNLHKDCIPQYNVGYQAVKEKTESLLALEYNGTLSLGGMCFGKGIGVPDCVSNALDGAIDVS